MGEVDLRAPFFTLSEVSELGAIVYGNGLKDLCKVVAVFLSFNIRIAVITALLDLLGIKKAR